MTTKKEKSLQSNIPGCSCSVITDPTSKQHFFEIHVKGILSEIWADWFDGFTIQRLEDGEMLLSGPIVDQSALMGVLNKLARLSLNIISLNEVNTKNKKEKK